MMFPYERREHEKPRLLLNICIVFYAFGVHFSFGWCFMPWNMIGMDHFATLVLMVFACRGRGLYSTFGTSFYH